MSAPQNDVTSGLYAAHAKVYPREVRGRFENFRTATVLALLGLFYGLPWLNWPLFAGGEHQAVLFDLPARKFYIFGLIFLPQDFYLITWLLIIAALSLFFFTALAGRLWCGYACPQTVWTTVFVWMERLAEGTRTQRIKLDKSPLNANKLLRKAAKQFMWVSFGLWTGFTFVGFFSPARELFAGISTLTLGPWETFWVLFYGFATYGNAGFMREQVCKYMCPYARFQSAMFDKHTLVIGYDTARGEPRGARGRGVDYRSQGLGDCIDCTMCVQVCPTGIDIRKGLQYECIACAACIDACDSVMDKMNYPRGLVRYSTQAMIEGNTAHVLRPRTIIYAVLLTALVLGFGYAVTHRDRVDIDVLRDRNALYRQLNDGRIENVYTVRIINKDTQSHEFAISVDDLPDAEIDSEHATYTVAAAEVKSVAVRVRVPAHAVVGGNNIELKIYAVDDSKIENEAKARFYAPRE
jgi:cytochrome c oxidase accessory protein FixG